MQKLLRPFMYNPSTSVLATYLAETDVNNSAVLAINNNNPWGS
jgi:hypothetical protein